MRTRSDADSKVRAAGPERMAGVWENTFIVAGPVQLGMAIRRPEYLAGMRQERFDGHFASGSVTSLWFQ